MLRNLFALYLSVIVLAVPVIALAVPEVMDLPASEEEELLLRNTIIARQRPELDPLGVRVGSFILLPKITLGLQYDDNIFAEDNDTQSDLIAILEPAIGLRSDWNRHAFGILADLEVGRYSDFSNENYEDYTILTDGRLDITGNSTLSGALSYAQLHESRRSPDDRGGITPTEYSETSGSFSFVQYYSRLFMRLNGGQQYIDYKNTPSLTGTIYNDDRDRVISFLSLRLGYNDPGYQVFIRGSTNSRIYDQRFDQFGFARSSFGYELVAGTALAYSSATFGEVFAGVLGQNYDDPRFDEIREPTFGGKITWNVSGLTALTGVAERIVDETTSQGAAGILVNRFSVRVDHELLRNLLLYGFVFTEKEDYQGIDRIDDINGINVNARYMINRNFYVSFDYDYERRNTETTTSGARNYKINTYTVSIESQI